MITNDLLDMNETDRFRNKNKSFENMLFIPPSFCECTITQKYQTSFSCFSAISLVSGTIVPCNTSTRFWTSIVVVVLFRIYDKTADFFLLFGDKIYHMLFRNGNRRAGEVENAHACPCVIVKLCTTFMSDVALRFH